jgi:hypothetical protein
MTLVLLFGRGRRAIHGECFHKEEDHLDKEV